MTTVIGGHDDVKTTQRKVRRAITSPCDRPPAAPGGVHLHFTAVEARTHLRFRGKIRWNDVTTDTSGLPINTVDRWDIQWRATDADGDPVESEDLKTIHRTKRRDPVNRIAIDAAHVVGSANEVQRVNLVNFGGQDEVQHVSLSNFGDGDSFKLQWGGEKSTRIQKGSNYQPEPIRRAIENIPGFAGQVEISAISPSGFDVTFGGRYKDQNVAELAVVDEHNCTGSVSTTAQGAGPRDRFKLSFAGHKSNYIVHGENYTREGIKHAIQNITGFAGTVDVMGGGTFDETGFTITYGGAYARTNVAKILFTDGDGCTGTSTTETEGDAGTGTFRFTTRGPHGFFPGDHVRITGCVPTAYNGSYTVLTVGDTVFTVNGTAGVEDLTDRGVVHDDDDSLHIAIPEVPRPRTWYWQARVRARSGAGCWSRWSVWTDPELPWTGADPRPPAPTFDDPGCITFDRVEVAKHMALRLRFTFDEVQDWDVPGGDLEPDVKAYAVQLDRSDDGITWDGRPYRQHHIDARDIDSTDDDDTPATRTETFMEIRRRFYYRCRVRTIDRFNRKGDWSDWTSGALPFDDVRPPNPLNVRIDSARDRIHVKWRAPTITIDTKGTVSCSGGSSTLTGTGTRFTIQVEAGQDIRVGDEARTVRRVTSNTSLTVTEPWDDDHTDRILKLVEEDPNVAAYRVQIARSGDVDTSETPDDWSDVYDSDTVREQVRKVFRIPDAIEDDRFYARVQTIDAALNHSRWVPARRDGNDDPDADGQKVQLIRDRVVLTAHVKGELSVGRLPERTFRIDRRYRIRRIAASLGFHDAATHPDDGTPFGQPVHVNWLRITADNSVTTSIIQADDRIRIRAAHHRGSAAAATDDFNVTELAPDDMVMPNILQVGAGGRPGSDLSTSLVLIPIEDTVEDDTPAGEFGEFDDAFSSAFDA